jgi:hypothetical protein
MSRADDDLVELDVPEPDAQEQRADVDAVVTDEEETPDQALDTSREANEADLIEQQQAVSEDEDYPHGGAPGEEEE